MPPANSLSTSTPSSSVRAAMNSFATRFMPSRSGSRRARRRRGERHDFFSGQPAVDVADRHPARRPEGSFTRPMSASTSLRNVGTRPRRCATVRRPAPCGPSRRATGGRAASSNASRRRGMPWCSRGGRCRRRACSRRRHCSSATCAPTSSPASSAKDAASTPIGKTPSPDLARPERTRSTFAAMPSTSSSDDANAQIRRGGSRPDPVPSSLRGCARGTAARNTSEAGNGMCRKPADARVRHATAQKLRHQHQLVVVHHPRRPVAIARRSRRRSARC